MIGGSVRHFKVYSRVPTLVCAGGCRGRGGRGGGCAVLVAVQGHLQLKLDGMDTEMQPRLQSISLVVLPATHNYFRNISDILNSALFFGTKDTQLKRYPSDRFTKIPNTLAMTRKKEKKEKQPKHFHP